MTHVPLRVQIALQGGGAKLVHLLAALEAAQEFQSQGRIEVTRIAGTSAGAIAGALFAAEESLASLRGELRMISPKRVRNMFKMPKPISVAWRAARNEPIWSTDEIKWLLNKKFGSKTLADLPIPLLPIAADIRDRRSYVPPATTLIVNALLDSAGLPFLFRTVPARDAPALVDGGICENLPSDFLLDQVASYGPVIGVSFSDATAAQTPTNLTSFAGAILETAITNSVSRAQRSLKSRIFAIATTINTLDFERALVEGLAEQYDLIKARATDFLERIESEIRAEINNSLWEQPKASILQTVDDIYELQHTEPFHVSRKSVCVRASSLDESVPGVIDESTFTQVFAPAKRDIYCVRVTLNSAFTAEFWGTYISVKNARGEDVPFRAVPLIDTKSKVALRQFLVFFTPPLRVGDISAEPYELIVQDKIKDCMSELRQGRIDYLKTSSGPRDGAIGEIDLVLYVPSQLTPLKMIPDCTCTNHELTLGGLKPYTAPPGFVAKAWRFQNVPPNASVRLNFVPS